MNTRRISFIAIMLSQLLWPLAASAGIASQSIAIDSAEQIEINVPIALRVEQGDVESLTLTDDDRDMKELRVKQQGTLLSIDRTGRDGIRISNHPKLHATLVVKKLTALHLNAAGTVTLASFKADRLELAIGGAGSMDLKDLRATSVELTIAGAGEIDASGVADTVSVHVSGLGTAALEGLASRSSRVMISGGGSVRLAASEDLDASISGIGQVRYIGSPHVFKSISGIGSVEPYHG